MINRGKLNYSNPFFSSHFFIFWASNFVFNRWQLQGKFLRIGVKVRRFLNLSHLVVSRVRHQDHQKEVSSPNHNHSHSHNHTHQYCHPHQTGSDNNNQNENDNENDIKYFVNQLLLQNSWWVRREDKLLEKKNILPNFCLIFFLELHFFLISLFL